MNKDENKLGNNQDENADLSIGNQIPEDSGIFEGSNENSREEEEYLDPNDPDINNDNIMDVLNEWNADDSGMDTTFGNLKHNLGSESKLEKSLISDRDHTSIGSDQLDDEEDENQNK